MNAREAAWQPAEVVARALEPQAGLIGQLGMAGFRAIASHGACLIGLASTCGAASPRGSPSASQLRSIR